MEVTCHKKRYIPSFIHVPIVGTVNLIMHYLLSFCPRSTPYLRKKFEHVIALCSRLQVSKPYHGIMANNQKGIRELSKHFFKNWLHDGYKSSQYISV
jgi:hypothetical protein